ncbi:hypothetical protein L6164_018934 [Bauhinia variegata]|uniref:Uncharacterized protein n=1 Tax=Bauhinia variegata TaxID=167791 RepID=A0ACB9NDW3_BAUVA|nr:hypothetical protein L6164_018934 [Bauhinia variegata]
MDLYDPHRFSHRKPTYTERFLGLPENPSSSSSTNGGDELNEDDVVFFTGDYSEPNQTSTPSSSSTSPTLRHHLHHFLNHHNYKGFGPPDSFGILAALPENEASTSVQNVSHFFHKASVSSSSSSSSSSSRFIPAIPKPPQDRIQLHTSASSVKYRQSAPVNVPVLSEAMTKMRKKPHEFDEDNGDEDYEEEEMLPPHEIVARNSAKSPMLACSVLEGAGRTLKGRDLRQVRNAVWRQTGFLD